MRKRRRQRSEDVVTEVIEAAMAVATSPTVSAYRTWSARKGIPAARLKRLIEALSDLDLTPEAGKLLDERLKANDAAEAAQQAAVERQLERAEAAQRAFHLGHTVSQQAQQLHDEGL